MSNMSPELALEQAQVEKETQERLDQIDFKMVTFSLDGKDYGIDIMKVKEIAKFNSFTYVPNSYPYVRGVYNLRGDIISILDLRILFGLSIPPNNTDADNGLILRLDENVIGVVVDSIDKVIGIASKDIQPPHPIFGDINIKYIYGVVENDGRLYIVLNADSICSKEETVRRAERAGAADIPPQSVPFAALPSGAAAPAEDPEKDFIRDTLRTFRSFYITPVNEAWFGKRFDEWKAARQRRGADIQLKSTEDADEFILPYYSRDTGRFWSGDLAAQYSRVFTDTGAKIINAWNVGCGKGYESYSVAGILSRNFSGRMIKIWANDNDLIAISTAPNLLFHADEIPDYLKAYVVTGKNGESFHADFKNRILFEYHDALHSNTLPDLDFIIARDVLPFLDQANQVKLFDVFHEKLKPSGILVLGDNEKPLDSSAWAPVANAHSAYRKP